MIPGQLPHKWTGEAYDASEFANLEVIAGGDALMVHLYAEAAGSFNGMVSDIHAGIILNLGKDDQPGSPVVKTTLQRNLVYTTQSAQLFVSCSYAVAIEQGTTVYLQAFTAPIGADAFLISGAVARMRWVATPCQTIYQI